MNAPMTPNALPSDFVPAPSQPTFVQRLRIRPGQVALGLALGLATEVLLDGAGFGVGHALFAVLLGGAIAFNGGKESWQRAGGHRWVLLGAVLLLASTMLHASTWLAVLSTLASVLLFAIAVQGWTGERPLSSLRTGQLLGWPFKTLGQSVYAGAVASSRGIDDAKITDVVSRFGPGALRLFFIVVPPALVLLGLLTSGDAVFRSRIGALEELLFGVPLSGFVRGTFVATLSGVVLVGVIVMTTRRRDGVIPTAPGRVLRSFETSALLGTLTAMLLAFGLTSTPCALSPSTCALPAGVTFSEAANEGFFQLLTAALGILVLLMALPARTQLETPSQKVAFTGLSTALVLATLPMIVSAVARLWRYESAYGLTVLRLLAYTGLFLVTAVLAWRAVTLWVAERAFVGGALALCTATLLALALLSPDAFIARRNLARGQGIDFGYLSDLSEDAIPALVEHGQLPTYQTVSIDPPLQWNLGRARARAALNP